MSRLGRPRHVCRWKWSSSRARPSRTPKTKRTKLSRKRRKPASVPSASDGVNELLRLAMIQEQYERLEAEAAEFHADPEGTVRQLRPSRKRPFGHWAGIDARSVRLVFKTRGFAKVHKLSVGFRRFDGWAGS